MAQIIQATPYVHLFWMVLLGTDTPALGRVVTVSVNKSGSGFVPPSGGATAKEEGFGWYSIQLLSSDTAVLGDLAYHYAAAGCDDSDDKDQVIPPPPGVTISNELQTMITLLGKLVAGLCPK